MGDWHVAVSSSVWGPDCAAASRLRQMHRAESAIKVAFLFLQPVARSSYSAGDGGERQLLPEADCDCLTLSWPQQIHRHSKTTTPLDATDQWFSA